ncbi:MAG: hypothetical protein WBD95_21750 [Xanthobacteraceae bacterium]
MVERNPKYDGLHVFKPDLTKLKSGDVLLTRNVETVSSRNKIQSDLVMKATGGNFSHALLCTKPPTFIEAIGQGVSNISVQNCFAHDLKNVKLLRYSDSAIGSAAGSIALPLLGQKYSIRAALQSILPNIQVSNVPEGQLFCSALVAAAFQKAGASEFSSIDPMKVTPAVLEKATYFQDVTSDVFVRILSPSNIEQMSALDGDRSESPMLAQAGLFQSYCDTLLPRINAFISQTPELTFTKRPTSFLECLMFIPAASQACDSLLEAVAGNSRSAIAEIDNLAYELLSDGRLEEMIRAATVIDETSSQYIIAQSFAPSPDIDLADIKGLIVATREQVDSRSQILGHADLHGRSRAFDEWLRISEKIVEIQKQRLQILEEVRGRVFPSERI